MTALMLTLYTPYKLMHYYYEVLLYVGLPCNHFCNNKEVTCLGNPFQAHCTVKMGETDTNVDNSSSVLHRVLRDR